ncbi:hypothetical protein E306M_04910 [Moorella sp. E306M]|nr:hypothetical protein E306M_04910 [Moorella sp. E306M]
MFRSPSWRYAATSEGMKNAWLAFVGSERLGPSGEAAQAKLRSEGGAEDRMSEAGL